MSIDPRKVRIEMYLDDAMNLVAEGKLPMPPSGLPLRKASEVVSCKPMHANARAEKAAAPVGKAPIPGSVKDSKAVTKPVQAPGKKALPPVPTPAEPSSLGEDDGAPEAEQLRSCDADDSGPTVEETTGVEATMAGDDDLEQVETEPETAEVEPSDDQDPPELRAPNPRRRPLPPGSPPIVGLIKIKGSRDTAEIRPASGKRTLGPGKKLLLCDEYNECEQVDPRDILPPPPNPRRRPRRR